MVLKGNFWPALAVTFRYLVNFWFMHPHPHLRPLSIERFVIEIERTNTRTPPDTRQKAGPPVASNIPPSPSGNSGGAPHNNHSPTPFPSVSTCKFKQTNNTPTPLASLLMRTSFVSARPVVRHTINSWCCRRAKKEKKLSVMSSDLQTYENYSLTLNCFCSPTEYLWCGHIILEPNITYVICIAMSLDRFSRHARR